MALVRPILIAALCTGLAACQWNDLERAGAGAATGAIIAGAANGNVVAGAAVGGALGALCDDLGVTPCQ